MIARLAQHSKVNDFRTGVVPARVFQKCSRETRSQGPAVAGASTVIRKRSLQRVKMSTVKEK